MKCHWGTPCYCETLATRNEYPDPANGQRAEETEAVITIIERTNLVVRRETSPSEYPQQTNHGPKIHPFFDKSSNSLIQCYANATPRSRDDLNPANNRIGCFCQNRPANGALPR